MTPPILQQPLVGHRLRALRERARLSRATLAKSADVSPSSLARLENGHDVRLSVYFKVTNYFLERTPEAWMLVERITSLGEDERAALIRQIGGDDAR